MNTPRLITNQAGNTVWQWLQTEPFGNTIPNQDPNNTGNQFVFNLRFAGQYADIETGLFYNYFRDYDPLTGRYVESDPIGLRGGINTFAYVGGNPIMKVDPRGLDNSSTGGQSSSVNETYICKAALGDPGRAADWNEASHAYTCVRENGVMTCKGLVLSDYKGNTELVNEKYDPNLCNPVSSSPVYGSCVKSIWDRGGN